MISTEKSSLKNHEHHQKYYHHHGCFGYTVCGPETLRNTQNYEPGKVIGPENIKESNLAEVNLLMDIYPQKYTMTFL